MSYDRIVKLHKVVKEPLRQKILLQFGLHKNMAFDDFMKSLKIQNGQELSNQLNILEKMIIEGEHLVIKQTNSSYQLTEKGHYVLDKIITFPQLSSDDYSKLYSNIIKPKPKWVTPFWIIIVVATIIVGATLPITQNIPLDRAVLILILALVAEGIVHRFEPLFSLNRVMYILICIVFMVFSVSIFAQWVNEDFTLVFGSLVSCFGVVALIGDFIRRLRAGT